MPPARPPTRRELMSREHRQPFAKRSLGQNFLVDPNYIRKIIAAADPQPSDSIVEIGPGRGAITEALVASGASVIAIELDSHFVSQLEEQFGNKPNFRIIEADATHIDFSQLKNGASPLKVVANLPYYISTAILQHLAAQREHFSTLSLMFQKEVVDRITARPGSSERGFLTVLTEIAFIVERLFDVPPLAFRPVPKVTSSVARLSPKPSASLDETALRSLLSTSFAQKRKTILNNLKVKYSDAAEMLERSGIDPSRRAESLDLEEWTRLLRAVD